MKTLRMIFLGIIAFSIIGLFIPQDYKVERSIEINSTLSRPFTLANNLTYWPQWNPWSFSNPSVKITIDDLYQGIGATQRWEDDTGGGHLTITNSINNSQVDYDIWFGNAKIPAISTISLEQVTVDTVLVNWVIEGDVQIPVIGFIVAMMMDNIMGAAFDSGLEKLKYESEKVTS